MEKLHFQVLDYVIFSICLVVSLSIGLYNAFVGGHQKTTDEFLMADRKIGFVPASLSLLVTIMSAITVLGVPSEIYQHGTSYGMLSFSYFFFIPIVAHCFIPVFYDMKITSAYEYLGHRFSKGVRLCATIYYVIMVVMYMGVVLYTPALAIHAVTGLNVWLSVIALSIICMLYTTLGGLKAVIWTDVFQALVMLVGQIIIIIIGCIKAGGLPKVLQFGIESGKITPLNFNLSPLVPHTIWSLCLGGIFLCLGIFGVNQTAVQRYMCCKSKKQAQITVYLNFPLLQLVMIISCTIGLVMYAEYRCQNPLALGVKPDQLLLHYVMTILGGYPGIPGLFVACLFCASLSTISSCFNSLSTVTIQDIVLPHFSINDHKATVLSKVLVLVYAILSLCMALIASQVESILKAALSILGIMGGPMLSLFLLGMFCRHINSVGALSGFITSSIVVFWIGFGGLAYRMSIPNDVIPPVYLEEKCIGTSSDFATVLLSNSTNIHQNTTGIPTPSNVDMYESINAIYKLSYMWYSGLSVIVSFVVSSIVSLVTGIKEDFDENTLHPAFRTGGLFGAKKPSCDMLIGQEIPLKVNERASSKL